MALSYCNEWEDGFGTRGWKLDHARDHSDVIAATAYPGLRSPTCVPVHDVLDHWLPGFGYGPWDEAKATFQHALRNGLDVDASYANLAREILGAMEQSELPTAGQPRRMMEALYLVGAAALPEALASWRRLGLDFTRRRAIGLCLQSLLEQAERQLAEDARMQAQALFQLGNDTCWLHIAAGAGFKRIRLQGMVRPIRA